MVKHHNIESIIGNIITVHVAMEKREIITRFGDLALIEAGDGAESLAQVIRIDGSRVSLQVFSGTRGISTAASVRFLGHAMQVTYSPNILGRIFSGTGKPMDGGSKLEPDPKVGIGGPTVNPMKRVLASKMMRTNVPMIDLFNCLVESQKIPIFSISGEPYNPFLARIGIQADADIVVFAGLGLIFDDYHFFRSQFEQAGVFARTVMYCNMASDPIVERLLVPDMALAVAERFAVEEGKRVLVLMTDMTAYADALKEVAVSMEHVPSNRGYTGDLYSQLARRYEKACDYKGAGTVTILTVTTMPGDDVTHPVPDNTGYITEGQFYLRNGRIEPFGSLSRLKQQVNKDTREDHRTIMDAMIKLYASFKETQEKQSMGFRMSDWDGKLLKYGERFEKEMMDLSVNIPLEKALDLGWQILADCFEPGETGIPSKLTSKFWPKDERAVRQ